MSDNLEVKSLNDQSSDSDENNSQDNYQDINKGKTRLRQARLIKKTQGCGVMCSKLIFKIRSKCGCNKSYLASLNDEPPKRHIYYGQIYDELSTNNKDNNNNNESIYITKEPHLDNEENIRSSFVSNYISTTKYTLLSFLPLNMFEQFRKVANLYFLIIAILSCTDLSPKSPLFSIFPLSVVLLVSAFKEAYEDYRRYQMDKEINQRKCLVYRPNNNGKEWEFRELEWKYIEVGDIVKITKDNRAFPADMLLLKSSTNQGLCNIETSNLDGETNLKIKQAISATYLINCDKNGVYYPGNKKLQFKLISEAPSQEIHVWKGQLYMNGNDTPIALSINQFLLRGCTLRNTDWIIACVVFTGVESKLSLNNKESPFKRSHVDKTVDKALYFIFVTQFILCLFGIISHGIYLKTYANNMWYQYIDNAGKPETNFFQQSLLNYFTFLVLLDLFVPISLYVSMEMVKVAQVILINSDDKMCFIDHDIDPDIKKEPVKIYAKARTSNLNEELGQISHIFSDKTGTLTQNKMEFLKCHVGDTRYGPGEMKKQNDMEEERVKTPENMPEFNTYECRFTDNRLALRRKNPIINEFLSLLSVCHSIIPEYPNGPDGKIVYNASSPDEKALVILAKNLHYYFFEGHVQPIKFRDKSIDGHRFYVNIFGESYKFDIYNMLEFTSKRKRMSVITKDPRDGKFKLYCKGADNVIYQRLKASYQEDQWEGTLESLKYFAAEGLRTLVCGYKTLTDEEYYKWLSKYEEAAASFNNRDIKIEQLYDEIEQELILLGATAIEDKLQDGVPETISNLSIAGISLWVLTGDKVETAINIGRSAKLLKPSMTEDNQTLIKIDPPEKMNKDKCKEYLENELNNCWTFLHNTKDNNPEQAFVISGNALSVVFPARKHDKTGQEIPPSEKERKEEERLQKLLLKVCKKCRAVICCRVSPIQKAQVVKLVKMNVPGTITLAIGDGANDVPMIKAAHVGIGISGQEGLQASMASDYAVSQFKHLKELLLVHGAWDYRRISKLILYSFYKNVCCSLTQVWFSFFSGFSGTLFYDPLSGSCYNLIYTAFPVLFAAVLDRPYSKQIARICPELYCNGTNHGSFSVKIFLKFFFEGIIHSLIIFFCNTTLIDSSMLDDGKITGFWVSATTQFTSLVMVVTARIMIETRTWTSWTIIIFFLSALSWFVFAISINLIPITGNEIYYVAIIAFRMPYFWFIIVLTVVLAMIPTFLYKYFIKMYYPTRFDVIEEMEYYPDAKRKFLHDVKEHRKDMKLKDLEYIKNTIENRKNQIGEHLGFSEFQVGRGHEDYVISQKKYLSIAMKKPRLDFTTLSNLVTGKKITKKLTDVAEETKEDK